MIAACKHPQVRVVARQDDVEFVECQSCREVFDAAEYADMALEEQEQAESLDGEPDGALAGRANGKGKPGRKSR